MITAEFLAELERFATARKHRSRSLFRGEHRSESRGEGLVYSDHRQYVPGDDTRRIDWKLYARTDELYVTQYEQERNLTVHVLLDASESMDFGDAEAGTHKFDFGAKLGLGYAMLFAEENNDFRFSVFGDDVRRLDSGATNRGELLSLVDHCNEVTLAGGTDFERALRGYADRIDSRSLVFVVSDFLAPADDVDAGLAALADNHLVTACTVAPEERDPPSTGETIFRDPETTRTRRTYFGGRTARSYHARLDDHLEAVTERAESLGSDHTVVDTGRDFFDVFSDVWVE